MPGERVASRCANRLAAETLLRVLRGVGSVLLALVDLFFSTFYAFSLLHLFICPST